MPLLNLKNMKRFISAVSLENIFHQYVSHFQDRFVNSSYVSATASRDTRVWCRKKWLTCESESTGKVKTHSLHSLNARLHSVLQLNCRFKSSYSKVWLRLSHARHIAIWNVMHNSLNKLDITRYLIYILSNISPFHVFLNIFSHIWFILFDDHISNHLRKRSELFQSSEMMALLLYIFFLIYR